MKPGIVASIQGLHASVDCPAMSHPTYAWQEPYMAAVYEADEMKMLGRILEATAAIDQRLRLLSAE